MNLVRESAKIMVQLQDIKLVFFLLCLEQTGYSSNYCKCDKVQQNNTLHIEPMLASKLVPLNRVNLKGSSLMVFFFQFLIHLLRKNW